MVTDRLIKALIELTQNSKPPISSQADYIYHLKNQYGIEATQSDISRALTKANIAKCQKKKLYHLKNAPINTQLDDEKIATILGNGNIIGYDILETPPLYITTEPNTAEFIAHHLKINYSHYIRCIIPYQNQILIYPESKETGNILLKLLRNHLSAGYKPKKYPKYE